MQRHYLNNFRKKPAIISLDWSFIPCHKSSEIIATITSSLLHTYLDKISSCLWQDRLISGQIYVTRTITVRLLRYIKLATHIYSLTHYAKGTQSILKGYLVAYSIYFIGYNLSEIRRSFLHSTLFTITTNLPVGLDVKSPEFCLLRHTLLFKASHIQVIPSMILR